MKLCNKCKTHKLLDKFSKCSKAKDGLLSHCKQCCADSNKSWRSKKVDIKAYDAAQNIKHAAKKAEYFQKHKEKKKLYSKKYKEDNKAKFTAWDAGRRAAKLNATPKWLSKQQYMEIRELYSLAKELDWLSESQLVVDHIVPLQGKDVCGLHVPWNLQILPQSLNLKKYNKVIG